MRKISLFVFINIFLALNMACSTMPTLNAEVNNKPAANANAANLPEGLSANQIPLSGNSTPGIPDPNALKSNSNSINAASTPGIPDPAKIGKTPVAGKTPPIPGIPDQETLRKQMNTPVDRSVMQSKPPQSDPNSGARKNMKRANSNSQPN